MKLKPLVDKLNDSKVYKQFTKQYKNAFAIAGFFILDLELGRHMHQIDYYVPSKKKIAAFNLDGEISFQLLDTMGGKIPEKLELNTNVDLDALQGILEDEMKNRSITEDIKKIIAILQNIDGKKIWNLSCILSGMEILKAHVEDESKTVLKMERTSMLDIMKKIPASELQKMQQQAVPGKDASAEKDASSEKDVGSEIENLDKLEKEIEAQKEGLKKQIEKSSKKKPSNEEKPEKAPNVKKKA